ncbi:MAG TPA: hypothetical protein VNJ70_00745 [Thermoanaerobaculia bacterium]|nr:hypothetical protein [Thermoanaerobaculia bacterium]
MATESFLVTALPYSADPGEPFHVSLFVTHRLTPDGAEGELRDFPNVVDWTARLAGAQVILRGRKSNGTIVAIGVTPLLAELDPDLWPRVFPPDLAVRPWRTPDHTAVPWRTFPAHRMQQHALFVHGVSMYSSPVAAPTVAGNALTRPLLNSLGVDIGHRLSIAQLVEHPVDKRSFEAHLTKRLDALTNGGFLGPDATSTAGQPLLQLVADVHRARRYYQRDEEQRPYAERPTPGTVPPPVRKPEPDFHERAGMLGDLSPLLRRLGLVIDLRVDNLAQLADLVWIQAGLVVPDLANSIGAQPRTACEVSGRTFTAKAASAEWTHGMLRLGDEKTFTVLDLDPDAAGLKLEMHVRNLPRLLAIENNGDRVNSAPPSLRATGLSIARQGRAQVLYDRLQGAAAKDAALLSGTAAPLLQEQISRGLRLEVWDDVSDDWHSLHLRRLHVEVEGAAVLDDAPDEGFLQGASLTQADEQPAAPMNAHEVLAGWDGWSLSAPRPGRTVVHVDGEEHVVDEPPPDPDPVNPVASRTAIEPGTLPRLRYGRSYAFRAYAVDLAGNSRPHVVAGDPDGDGDGGPPALAESVTALAAAALAAKPLEATVPAAVESAKVGLDVVRQEVRALRPPRAAGPVEGRGVPGLSLAEVEPTGVADVDRLVVSRLADRAARVRAAGPARRERIEAAFDAAAAEAPQLLVRTDAQTPAPVYGRALATDVRRQRGFVGLALADAVALSGQTVTTPRPFLRWDPVIEPAIVPRHAFSEGESLQRLVVRSGVDGPVEEGGLEATIVPPDVYVPATIAAHPTVDLAWGEDSQRHLAPPKTSQLEAELHGRFDAAIGSGSAAAVRAALAVALREAGTFFDTTVADLANPGQRLPQPGVTLHLSPTAEEPVHATPEELPRGEAPTPGQYVAHDVDELVVPYLPDPLAAGVSLTFPDAGRDHRLTGLLAVEGTTLRYPGAWPVPRPYRLVLAAGDELGAAVDGTELRITVPPGEQLRMRMSSCLDRASLDLLGLWRSLPAVLRSLDILAEAAADGWFWWLTPSVEMTLVHAVPKPVEVPRPTILVPFRANLDTAVTLFGGIDVHGPSTERIDVEGAWSEWVDDIAKPAPERVDVVAAACGTKVGYDEDLVVLSGTDNSVPLPDGTTLRLHKAVHQMGDTKHRTVEYRVRATTRYREYFSPLVTPSVDDLSLVGPVRRLNVLSSARPPKAVVRDVLPLFLWDERTEPAQPFGLRRTRRTGVRIYLDRPWYATGDGELLGVLLAVSDDADVVKSTSQWASDPVWAQQGPAARAALPLADILHLTGLDDRRIPGRPVGPPAARPLVDLAGSPSVWVLGYEPEFSPARGLWFVDVAFDPRTAFWPFIRLAVARYQPDSNPGMHLSAVTVCDFAQLTPERTATLTRPDDRHVRVVVTGPVGVPKTFLPSLFSPPFVAHVQASRTVRARLERRVPAVGTDLGWQAVAQVDLPILGIDGTVVSWAGQLELPQALPPRRPGENTRWRVVVEEWERLPADPSPTGEFRLESRICYADHLPL